MKQFIAPLAVLVLASGCATAPQQFEFDKTRTIPESKDVVWERLVGFFASNNLSIKTIEKDSGIIAAERMIGRPGSGGKILDWADCGSELLMTPINQTADLNVFVRPAPGGATVTVNTRFSESRQFADERPTVTICNSTGALERELLAAAGG